jgi:hypothetical protein
MRLTDEQRAAINNFLATNVLEFTQKLSRPELREMKERAYRNWLRAGNGYSCLQQGGTGQLLLIMYYQNKIKTNSREWRPPLIIRGVLREIRSILSIRAEIKTINQNTTEYV